MFGFDIGLLNVKKLFLIVSLWLNVVYVEFLVICMLLIVCSGMFGVFIMVIVLCSFRFVLCFLKWKLLLSLMLMFVCGVSDGVGLFLIVFGFVIVVLVGVLLCIVLFGCMIMMLFDRCGVDCLGRLNSVWLIMNLLLIDSVLCGLLFVMVVLFDSDSL